MFGAETVIINMGVRVCIEYTWWGDTEKFILLHSKRKNFKNGRGKEGGTKGMRERDIQLTFFIF